MGCNSCKSKNNTSDSTGNSSNSKLSITDNIIAKIILWVIACALTLLIIPVAWIMLFRQLVLTKSTNIIPSLVKLGGLLGKKKEKNEEDDYIPLEDVNPDDYELDNVEVIR